MAKIDSVKRICGIFFLTVCALHLTGLPVLAEDGGGNWRSIYDTIMIWVNFAILAYVIYRYGRHPFKMFLKGQADQVSKEIEEVESRKKQIQDKIEETRREIQDSSERFERIKVRIIEEGERIKQQIIDDARRQSQNMFEQEKRKAARRLVEARNQFMSELVDTATQVAQDRLPGELTEDDHQKMLDFYMANVNRMAG